MILSQFWTEEPSPKPATQGPVGQRSLGGGSRGQSAPSQYLVASAILGPSAVASTLQHCGQTRREGRPRGDTGSQASAGTSPADLLALAAGLQTWDAQASVASAVGSAAPAHGRSLRGLPWGQPPTPASSKCPALPVFTAVPRAQGPFFPLTCLLTSDKHRPLSSAARVPKPSCAVSFQIIYSNILNRPSCCPVSCTPKECHSYATGTEQVSAG